MRAPTWLTRWRARRSTSGRCPECGATVPLTTCEVCGYDIVRRTRETINPQQDL